jgi:hypothetical protein
MFDQYIVSAVRTLGLFLGCLHLSWAVVAFKTSEPNAYSAFIAAYSFVTGASLFGIVFFPPDVFGGYAILSAVVCSVLVVGGIIIRCSEYFWRQIESHGFFYVLQVFWTVTIFCLVYLLQAHSNITDQVIFP